MLYRQMKKLDENLSLLGMGAMRLPTDSDGAIDEAASIQLIRNSIDSGINYVDTAFSYPKSEKILGKALKDGYREKTFIADKLPTWLLKSEDDVESMFNKSFERLDVDVIDFYLVHNLFGPLWKKAQKYNVLEFLEKKRAEGKIRYIGFSFHDDIKLFKEIIDAYDWDFCQIQLNFMDKNFQAGLEGLKYANEKGIDVIIMEPLKGGRLTTNVPPAIQEIWDSADEQKSPVEWAFKWLASKPEVSLILSGMSNQEQLEDNLNIFSKPDLEEINDKQLALLDKVSDKYNALIKYQCTGCKYCLPCPQKIDIPTMLKYVNDWNTYDKPESVKFEYTTWQVKHGSDCVDCHACEEKCPQSLPIAAAMKEAAEEFGI